MKVSHGVYCLATVHQEIAPGASLMFVSYCCHFPTAKLSLGGGLLY